MSKSYKAVSQMLYPGAISSDIPPVLVLSTFGLRGSKIWLRLLFFVSFVNETTPVRSRKAASSIQCKCFGGW